MKIECHLRHSGSLARQGSSTLAFPKPVPQSKSLIINHDGEICTTNSWELMTVSSCCRGRLCPSCPVCLPLCWLTRPGWFTSTHWRHSHILQRWAEHNSGCRHLVLLTSVVHKVSCLKCLLLLTAQSGSELQLLHTESAEGWCSWKRFQEPEVKKDWALVA